MYESGKTTTFWCYLLLADQRQTSGSVYKGALRKWLRLSVCNQPGSSSPGLSLLTFIHPSAWNRNSANFAFWGFSEVELPIYGVLRSSVPVFGTLQRKEGYVVLLLPARPNEGVEFLQEEVA
jgi:hypothetical protein